MQMNEQAAITKALTRNGIDTTICPRCGSKEAGPLRYECGSHWQAPEKHGDPPDLMESEGCRDRGVAFAAVNVLVGQFARSGDEKRVHGMTMPDGVRYQVEVRRMEVDDV